MRWTRSDMQLYAAYICSILALLLTQSTLAQTDDVCIFVNTPSDPFTCPAPQKAPQFHIAEDPIGDVEAFQRLQNAMQETMRPSFTSTLFSVATSTETSTVVTATTADPTTSAIIAQSEDSSATPSATPNEMPPFLSFSEWREVLLAKEGRAKQGDSRRKQRSAGRHVEPAPDQNAVLDSFDGGDTDFGFGLDESHDIAAMHPKLYPPSFDDEDAQPLKHSRGSSEPEAIDPLQQSKDRVNYAMLDSGAQIMSCNKEARGVKAVLISSRDSYMLNKCSSKDKHFVVELSDDIKVDSIVLGNFEFFSSMFKDVKISVSKKYPVKDDEWTEIGKFRARNVRDLQLFQVLNHETFFFARYVRIDFLSHYGHEYYCPLTVLRVHGKTEMEDYEDYVQALKREEAGENDAADVEGELAEEEELLFDLEPKYTEPPILDIFDKPGSIIGTDEIIEPLPSESAIEPPSSTEEAEYVNLPDMSSAYANMTTSTMTSLSISSSETESIEKVTTTSAFVPDVSSTTIGVTLSFNATSTGMSSVTNEPASMPQNATSQVENCTMLPDVQISVNNSTSSTMADNPSVLPSLVSSAALNASSTIVSFTSDSALLPSSASSSASTSSSASSTSIASPHPPIPSNPAPPSPTTSTQQESIYKTIMKRLTVLEQNATLSLQYIEEQSKMLKEVFMRMEDNQNRQLREFIGYLNDTAVRQVDGLKRKYETLWQATLMEVENYKEKSNEELTDLSSRVRVLTDEVVFEKRIGIAQLVLLLTTVIVMGFTRGSRSALPLPIELYYRARNQSPPKIFGEQRRASADQENKRRPSTTAVREIAPTKDSRRPSVDTSVTMSPAPASKPASTSFIPSPVIKRQAAVSAPIRVVAPSRPISLLQQAVLTSPPLPWLMRVQLNPVLWVPPNKDGIRVRHRVITSPLERMSARNPSRRIMISARRAMSSGGRQLPGELLHPILRKRSLSPTTRPAAQMNGTRPSPSTIEAIKTELRTLGRLVGEEAQ